MFPKVGCKDNKKFKESQDFYVLLHAINILYVILNIQHTSLVMAIPFIASLLPAILLFIYIWRKDPKPEPFRRLAKAILYGAAICVPVVYTEMLAEALLFGSDTQPTNLIGTTLQAFFVAAVPEECFKFLALWLVLHNNPFFDEHFDGIVYAVCVGLGFATIENVVYVMGETEWMNIAIGRALLAVPGHYAFGILMGYYYSLYHFVDHSPRMALLALLMPILAHGIYDSIAMSGQVNPYIGAISFFVLIYFCIRMHRFSYKRMIAQIQRDRNERHA